MNYPLDSIISFFPSTTINGFGELSPHFDADALFVCRNNKVLVHFQCAEYLPDEDGEPDEPLYAFIDDSNYVGMNMDDVAYDILEGGFTINTMHDGDDGNNSALVTELNLFFAAASKNFDWICPFCTEEELSFEGGVDENIYWIHECSEYFEDGYAEELVDRIMCAFINKKHYLVQFDNCVTDDVIVKHYYAPNIHTVDRLAYKYSRTTGLSEGNYEIFEEVR